MPNPRFLLIVSQGTMSALDAYAAQNGMTRTEAARHILCAALKINDDVQHGGARQPKDGHK
jgi:hypothetical protein